MSNFNSADSRYQATTSEKFNVVKTSEIIDSLTGQGFEVVKFAAQKVINADRQGFQRHEYQLTHPSITKTINGSLPRLLLRNGHDGTSPLVLTFGVYRIICSLLASQTK